jgi:hypothetical protein
MSVVEVVRQRKLNITSELKNWNLIPIGSGPPHFPMILGNDTKTVMVRKGPASVEFVNYDIVHKVNSRKIACIKLNFDFNTIKSSVDIIQEEVKGFVLCEAFPDSGEGHINYTIKMTWNSDIIAEVQKWLESALKVEA